VATKIDQKWAQSILANVNALISEVERLEGQVESLEARVKSQGEALAGAEKALENAVPKVHEYLPSVANDLTTALAKLRESAKDARIADLLEANQDYEKYQEEAEIKIADLSARLEEARRSAEDLAKTECTCGADDGDNLGSGGQETRCFIHEILARLGSPSPVAALKDKVVELIQDAIDNGEYDVSQPVLDAMKALAAAKAQEKP